MLVLAVSLGFVVGGSSTASAGDTWLYLEVGGHTRGYMFHSDPDPDWFCVGDDYADGEGVTGRLYQLSPTGVDWRLIASETDGGDNFCDDFYKPIYEGEVYKMELCWKSYCKEKGLYE